MSLMPWLHTCRAAFLLLLLFACGREDPVAPVGEGSLIVVVQTSGPDPDPDGYTLLLDGTTHQSLPAAGTTKVTDLSAGEHTMELTGVATNCAPAPALPIEVTIAADTDATVTLEVVCNKLLRYDLAYSTGAIYLRPATGEAPRRLTNDIGAAGPVWSPDGRRLAFRTVGPRNDTDLFVVEADGSGLVQLTSGADTGDTQPEWSPDGSLILFTRKTQDGTDLYTIRPDGSDERNLTPGAGYDDSGDWSPHGRQIAFLSKRRGTTLVSGDTIAELHIMDADGSNVRLLSSEWGLNGTHMTPDWSPDGNHLVFSTHDLTFDPYRPAVQRSYQVNVDGTNLIELGDYVGPEWSPDGDRILMTRVSFGGGPLDPSSYYLAVREVSSGDTRILRQEPYSVQVFGTWDPDGELIAFCNMPHPDAGLSRVPGMYVIAPDGSGFAQVLPDCGSPMAWRPAAQ